MELKIEVTEEQIQEAIARQVRVALGHLFQSKEVNKMVKDYVRDLIPTLLAAHVAKISMPEVEVMFMEALGEAIDAKVKTRLKGL